MVLFAIAAAVVLLLPGSAARANEDPLSEAVCVGIVKMPTAPPESPPEFFRREDYQGALTPPHGYSYAISVTTTRLQALKHDVEEACRAAGAGSCRLGPSVIEQQNCPQTTMYASPAWTGDFNKALDEILKSNHAELFSYSTRNQPDLDTHYVASWRAHLRYLRNELAQLPDSATDGAREELLHDIANTEGRLDQFSLQRTLPLSAITYSTNAPFRRTLYALRALRWPLILLALVASWLVWAQISGLPKRRGRRGVT